MALQRETHTLHKSPRQRDRESRQDAGRVFLVVYFLHKPGETERSGVTAAGWPEGWAKRIK